MAINNVTISGNLTSDPTLRGKDDFHALSFSVAVNDRVKQGDDWVDRPNYIDCVCFGKRAQSLNQFLAKGMKVAVQGKLRQSTWEKDGAKRSKIEVVVAEIEVMTPKGDAKPKAKKRSDYDDVPFYE